MGTSQSLDSKIVSIGEISNATLIDLNDGSEIKSNELWTNFEDKVIIYVVRRPGCPLCREQAQNLSNLVKFGLRGVQLVAIIHERTFQQDISGFQAYLGAENKIYFDGAKHFYNALGGRYLGYEALLWPSVIRALRRVMSLNIEGTMSGEGRLLGGLLVVQKNMICYEHKEQFFGDWPSNTAIVKAIELNAVRQMHKDLGDDVALDAATTGGGSGGGSIDKFEYWEPEEEGNLAVKEIKLNPEKDKCCVMERDRQKQSEFLLSFRVYQS